MSREGDQKAFNQIIHQSAKMMLPHKKKKQLKMTENILTE